jgi:predicted nucleotide-binding protein
MPYYHVAITKKGNIRCFAFNMSLDEINKGIITPFVNQKRFMCKTSVINPSDIENLRIVETTDSASQILKKTRAKRIFFKVFSEGPRTRYIDEWEIIGSGKDVTEELIKKTELSEDISKKITTKDISKPTIKESVFIVHGRDDKQALLLQKYLKEKLKVNAIMFDDFPDKGRTIIEQLEYIRNHVYYAFIIATPDDLGCLKEDMNKIATSLKSQKNVDINRIFEVLPSRARQNVVFELGLFIGALDRKNVCCLIQNGIGEKPSDIHGILYKPFATSVTEIFYEIAEELKDDKNI